MSKTISREQTRVLRLLQDGGLAFNVLRFDWGVSERTILSMERKGLIERYQADSGLHFRAR